MGFPRTVDEITPAWLTRVLRDSGAIRDAKVESFSATGLVGGVAGDVNRLELAYAGPANQGPATVIAKLAVLDDDRRSRINGTGAYEREARLYRELSSEVGMPTPSANCVEFDRKSGHFVLLLEDLGRFRSIDQWGDCSFEDGSSALQALAKMHAKWWENDRLYALGWLTDFTDVRRLDQVSDDYADILERFLEICDGYLPAGYEAVARKYGESVREVVGHWGKSPVTFLHGDFRLANLCLNDEPGAPDAVVCVRLAGRFSRQRRR